MDRPDPVALLEEQNRIREADLVPVRHGRMLVSPFTFYRGPARIMAADLEGAPTAGTTRRSSRRSDRDDYRHSKASEGGDAKPPPRDRQAECLARLAAALGRQ
jgi:hypothetical protein